MRCFSCDKEAYLIFIWGSNALPYQKVVLCEEHGKELWEKLNPLLKMNKAWVTLEKPDEHRESS